MHRTLNFISALETVRKLLNCTSKSVKQSKFDTKIRFSKRLVASTTNSSRYSSVIRSWTAILLEKFHVG